MKKTTLVLTLTVIAMLTAAGQQPFPGDSIRIFTEFLRQNAFHTPSEYILKSLQEKDIVILSERYHPEMTQYRMIAEVISDPSFTGNVYTEVGVVNAGDRINALLMRKGLADTEVDREITKIFKDLDMFPLWPNPNYFFLIKTIYLTNQGRPAEDKISLFPLDLLFSWDSVECAGQYRMLMEMMEPQGAPPVIDRNQVMGEHFILAYERSKRQNKKKVKALVIMNTYHGYTRIPAYLPLPTKPFIYSTAEMIYKTYPLQTKGISIHGLSNGGNLIARGKWDAAMQVNGNKQVGFDLKGTPFGATPFDMYNFGGRAYASVTFDYIFDGYVFYEPLEKFEMTQGIPGIFDDPAFVREFIRRYAISDNLRPEQADTSTEIRGYIRQYNILQTKPLKGLDGYGEQINKWLRVKE